MHHVRSGLGSPDASSNSSKRKRGSCFMEQNMDDRNLIRIKPEVGMREKCGEHRYVIDLEKPAISDDDMEFVSYASFGNRSQDHYVLAENCSTAESSQLCTERNASRVSPGSVGSSDTPDCQSPIKPDNTEPRHLLIDLNVPQEESLHVFYAPSQIACPTLVNSSSSHPGDFWNGSSDAYKKECGSGVGSSKESSITVVAPSSAPDSSRKVIAAYPFHDPKNLQGNIHARENSQHEHAVDKLCGPSSQYFLPQQRLSVSSSGRNDSFSGLQKSSDNHVACQSGQPPLAVHTKLQHDTSIVISSGEEKILFDLNVPAESIDMESTITSNSFRDKLVKNDGSEETVTGHSFSKRNGVHAETSIEERTVGYHHISGNKDGNSTFFQVSRINKIDKAQSSDILSVNSKRLIAETPHVDNIVCPQLRASHDGASSPQEILTGNCDKTVCIAAETLVSIFSSSVCTTDCPGTDSQAAAEDVNDEAQHSLDSYGEIVLNVEEIRDDGESIPVIPPDKDGPSCGIKLRRGRGLRNFLREIMPGLVSLSRHEICDDLHAIGYEPRKTRSRKSFGVQGSSSTRGRPPKHRPTARK